MAKSQDPASSPGPELSVADGAKRPWRAPALILASVSLRKSGKAFFPLEGANFSSTVNGAPISTPHGPS